MLLPLQGAWILPLTITQGVALGYVLLGFQPVLLITIRNYLLRPFTFDTPSCVLLGFQPVSLPINESLSGRNSLFCRSNASLLDAQHRKWGDVSVLQTDTSPHWAGVLRAVFELLSYYFVQPDGLRWSPAKTSPACFWLNSRLISASSLRPKM